MLVAITLVELVFIEIVSIADPKRLIDPTGIDPPSYRHIGDAAVAFSDLSPGEISLPHGRASSLWPIANQLIAKYGD
ncbi:hypothetical protein GOL88_15215 [Sinorhizobium medicae]|nr:MULTISPECIES: hypothetical protein [Sinorhizobium]MDE3766141.1 hypothetical protein [Sinorhizobium meliloti]MDE3781233.1 hypothetical protein [Sinorhizobium meliloti]MDE3804004.1 hypothetical protein [Sinorhizobium meliloti]MDX0524999.1 hypothetical protein [Sinorhizobium medicae]MDX0549433.1 hypothetical protein [Sinorhizobium medicae]